MRQSKEKRDMLIVCIPCTIIAAFLFVWFGYKQAEFEAEKTRYVTEKVVEESDSEEVTYTTETYQTLMLPTGANTSFYAYMDLDTIDDVTSKQYAKKSEYWLQESTGLWCHENDYVVAVAPYYGKIGDRLYITTDEGNEYTVYIGELKDSNDLMAGMYTPAGENLEYCNVIEFVVDTDTLSECVRNSGNVGDYYFIGGNIRSIEKI